MLPGIEDKHWDVLGMRSETLDLLLYGLECNLACEELAEQLRMELIMSAKTDIRPLTGSAMKGIGNQQHMTKLLSNPIPHLTA